MKIAFISSMYGATWGGSEELWGGAALVLLEQGVEVFAGGHRLAWAGTASRSASQSWLSVLDTNRRTEP